MDVVARGIDEVEELRRGVMAERTKAAIWGQARGLRVEQIMMPILGMVVEAIFGVGGLERSGGCGYERRGENGLSASGFVFLVRVGDDGGSESLLSKCVGDMVKKAGEAL